MVGLGGGGSTYDYGFRIYNPALGRFLSVDPLFKSFPFYTPYQFAGNKPIYAIDLDGLEEQQAIDGSVVNGPYNIQKINRLIVENQKQSNVQSYMGVPRTINPNKYSKSTSLSTVSDSDQTIEEDYALRLDVDISFGPNLSLRGAIAGHGVGGEIGITAKAINLNATLASNGESVSIDTEVYDPNINATVSASTPLGTLSGNVEMGVPSLIEGPQLNETSVSATTFGLTTTMKNTGNGPEFTQNITVAEGSIGAGFIKVDVSLTSPSWSVGNNYKIPYRDPGDYSAVQDKTYVDHK